MIYAVQQQVEEMVEEGEKEGKKGADILTHFPSKGNREEFYGKNNAQYD